MRIVHAIIAAAIVAAAPSIPGIRSAVAQETIVIEEPAMSGMEGSHEPHYQRPAWHGNVEGDACGRCSVGRVHGKFHADSCGQWHQKHHLPPGVCMPPAFPRLHAWFSLGSLPAPPPLELPRCHQCGAVIAGGF